MPSKIKTKNSLTTTNTPALGSLEQGELAVNIPDQKLWVGDSLGNAVIIADPASAGAGEANTASTPDAVGEELTMAKDGIDLPFKSLVAGAGVTLTPASDSLTIDATGAGGGEANTTSSPGAGATLVLAKNGVDLPFKSLVAGTNVTLSPDVDTITISAAGGSSSNAIVGEIKAYNASFGGPLPFGWYLCDGSNGTPDYTGRTLFAAGTGFTDGAVGGALPVAGVTNSAGLHSHSVSTTTGVATDNRGDGGDHTHNMVPQVVQSGTGVTVASNAQPSMQGNDHYHFGSGTASAGSGTNHTHTTPAPTLPPYAVVTGYIIYLGV